MSFKKDNIIMTGHFNFPQEKNELNTLWSSFMTSFNYSSYYNLDSKKISEFSNFNIPNSLVKNIAIKKLNEFFKKNSISINNEGSLNCSSYSSYYLLSEVKIWIMYIILNLQNPLCTTEKILNIFSYAIKFNVDSISLFEFFLIYISQLSNQIYENDIQNTYSNLIPEEFVLIYKEKQNILYKIFKKDEKDLYDLDNENFEEEDTNMNNFSFSKSFQDNSIFQDELITEIKCPNLNIKKENDIDNYLISDDKEDNKNIIIDDYKIISKDFENKGLIALLEKIDKTNNITFIPLKKSYSTFYEKIETRNLIINISKIYSKKNIEYLPYKIEIINKL
jgi:hypothetical protein